MARVVGGAAGREYLVALPYPHLVYGQVVRYEDYGIQIALIGHQYPRFVPQQRHAYWQHPSWLLQREPSILARGHLAITVLSLELFRQAIVALPRGLPSWLRTNPRRTTWAEMVKTGKRNRPISVIEMRSAVCNGRIIGCLRLCFTDFPLTSEWILPRLQS